MFGHIIRRKKRLINRIEGIQCKIQSGWNPFLEDLEAQLQKELHETLQQEEVLWYQKCRGEWIRNGDRNTRYYHTKAIVRRRRNKIITLRNYNGD